MYIYEVFIYLLTILEESVLTKASRIDSFDSPDEFLRADLKGADAALKKEGRMRNMNEQCTVCIIGPGKLNIPVIGDKNNNQF
jgi:hypothetical protein